MVRTRICACVHTPILQARHTTRQLGLVALFTPSRHHRAVWALSWRTVATPQCRSRETIITPVLRLCCLELVLDSNVHLFSVPSPTLAASALLKPLQVAARLFGARISSIDLNCAVSLMPLCPLGTNSPSMTRSPTLSVGIDLRPKPQDSMYPSANVLSPPVRWRTLPCSHSR